MTADAPNDRKQGRGRLRREPVTLDQKPISVSVGADEQEQAAQDNPSQDSLKPEQPPVEVSPQGSQQAATSNPDDKPDERAASVEDTVAASGPDDKKDDAPVTESTPRSEAAPENAAAQNEKPDNDVLAASSRTEQDAVWEDVPPAAAAPQGPSSPEKGPERKNNSFALLFAAIFAGGVAGAAISLALPSLRGARADIETRLASVEQSVTETASRSVLNEVSESVARLAQKSGEIETRVAEAESGMTKLMTGAETGAAGDAAAVAAFGEKLAAAQQDNVALGEKLDATGQDITSLKEQIGQIDQKIAPLDAERLNAAVAAQQGLGERLAALETSIRQFDLGRLGALADTQGAEISRLTARVSGVEGAVTAAEHKAAQISVGNEGRIAVVTRLALTERLARALDQGRPLASEIDALVALGVSETALAPLRASAGGVSTLDGLIRQITEDSAKFAIPEVTPDSSFMDKLAASAARVVRVTPIDLGDSPDSIAGQIAQALRRGDTGAALQAWERLPERQRQQSQDFASKLNARIAAENAVTAIARAQLTAIGNTGKGE